MKEETKYGRFSWESQIHIDSSSSSSGKTRVKEAWFSIYRAPPTPLVMESVKPKFELLVLGKCHRVMFSACNQYLLWSIQINYYILINKYLFFFNSCQFWLIQFSIGQFWSWRNMIMEYQKLEEMKKKPIFVVQFLDMKHH